eukprot:scaffold207_cov409-Prasinococcus_capsulatus_cf.AAC.74
MKVGTSLARLGVTRRVLALLAALETVAAQAVRPAVTTWTANTFAARITEHSVCHKALEPTKGKAFVLQPHCLVLCLLDAFLKYANGQPTLCLTVVSLGGPVRDFEAMARVTAAGNDGHH